MNILFIENKSRESRPAVGRAANMAIELCPVLLLLTQQIGSPHQRRVTDRFG